ncbi:MAG TPA: response regulator [Arsenicitalea sp.]|jgi:CheY-like chemotaxis protein|nr:response regulator [Arsenicitalea sp.]
MEAVDLSKLRVLVADPNAYLASLTTGMLRTLGVSKIVEVNTSDAAIKAITEKHFDAIVVDDLLKPLDGIDLTRKLRAKEGNANRLIPVIMVFTQAEKHHIEQARDAGVTEFIKKPLSAKVLEMRLVPSIASPRPFVAAPSYLGPDRRRREAGFDGENKRAGGDKPEE